MVAAKIAPEILPPAFFPVSLNVAGRSCVVIGKAGDREAADKADALRACGAVVVRITEYADLRDEDVSDAYFVILTPQEEAPAARLRQLAERYRFLLCTIDQPKYGSVALVATVTSGRARVAISTGGVAPRVGAQLKAALSTALDERFARFLECFAVQRRRARATYTESEPRRSAMKKAADGFHVEIRLTYPQWFRDELRRRGPSVIDDRNPTASSSV
jgi:siroheme synthase (precorrin-2 oxidase/ferrochelatase)